VSPQASCSRSGLIRVKRRVRQGGVPIQAAVCTAPLPASVATTSLLSVAADVHSWAAGLSPWSRPGRLFGEKPGPKPHNHDKVIYKRVFNDIRLLKLCFS
jgi:hypothetical protein